MDDYHRLLCGPRANSHLSLTPHEVAEYSTPGLRLGALAAQAVVCLALFGGAAWLLGALTR